MGNPGSWESPLKKKGAAPHTRKDPSSADNQKVQGCSRTRSSLASEKPSTSRIQFLTSIISLIKSIIYFCSSSIVTYVTLDASL